MGSASTKFTADELESIFIWDLLCEIAPLTLEERKESRLRDQECSAASKENENCRNPGSKDMTEERKQKKREAAAAWRAAHREEKRRKDAEYRNRNRDTINQRQREYEQAKRAVKRSGVSQPVGAANF